MKLLLPIFLKLFGINNFCPICKSFYKSFDSYGVVPRKNALCRKCGSLERHKMLFLFLKDKTDIFSKNVDLLHFAPEKCLELMFSKFEKINYVTADLERNDVMYKIDITNIPFKDESFDRILCIHVLEHVEDDIKALKELKRILKKDGWAIIQVPISGKVTYENKNIKTTEDRLIHFGQKDHVRIYGEDFKQRIIKSGLKVRVIDFTKTINRKLVNFYSLIPENKDSDCIYFVSK